MDEYVADTIDPRPTSAGLDGRLDAVLHHAPGRRPVTVHHWTTPRRVRAERDEALAHEVPAAARPYLDGVVDVVGVGLGWSAHQDGGGTVAWELVRAIVRHCAGAAAVRDDDDRWCTVRDGTWVRL